MDARRVLRSLRTDSGSAAVHVPAFDRYLRERREQARIAEDLESADLNGVTGTPTFFINGRRHYGGNSASALLAATSEAAPWPNSISQPTGESTDSALPGTALRCCRAGRLARRKSATSTC